MIVSCATCGNQATHDKLVFDMSKVMSRRTAIGGMAPIAGGVALNPAAFTQTAGGPALDPALPQAVHPRSSTCHVTVKLACKFI